MQASVLCGLGNSHTLSGLWCHTLKGGPSGPLEPSGSFPGYPVIWGLVSPCPLSSRVPAEGEQPQEADPGAKLSGFKASLAPQERCDLEAVTDPIFSHCKRGINSSYRSPCLPDKHASMFTKGPAWKRYTSCRSSRLQTARATLSRRVRPSRSRHRGTTPPKEKQ